MRVYKKFLLFSVFSITVLVTLLRWHTSRQIDFLHKPPQATTEIADQPNVTDDDPSRTVIKTLATYGLNGKYYPPLPAHASVLPTNAYTKAVIIGKISWEDVDWLDSDDIPSTVQRYIYNLDDVTNVDNPTEPAGPSLLSVPKARGHEAMAYLTYIISNYDRLADVNIFMHPHRIAWHNNMMLNYDAVEHVKRLSAERVIREGYMNLRCEWKPGCPNHISPRTDQIDEEKPEQYAIGQVWSKFFPEEELPDVLGSACCAQFAATRDRLRSLPLDRYEMFRQWLLDTDLRDYVSGRVFEYLWHRIFTGKNVHCPDMRECHCDAYGLCFEDEQEFDYWFQLRQENREAEKEWVKWKAQAKKFDESLSNFGIGRQRLDGLERAQLDVPAVDRDLVLEQQIVKNSIRMGELRLKALQAGTDPRVRARLAGREWKDGDGY